MPDHIDDDEAAARPPTADQLADLSLEEKAALTAGRDVWVTCAVTHDSRKAQVAVLEQGTGKQTFARYLQGTGIDHVHELSYDDRKRIHNLKYYTWVEQQGKTYDEIQAQWYDPDYWTSIQAMADPIDELIVQFNEQVGLN